METEEKPAVELYDFLYRDSNRLTSYYAQIFQGNLLGFEELETDTDSKERTLKGDIKLASLSSKLTDSKQASAKRSFDPHDQNTSDVLAFLQENHYIHSDYESAPNGALIIAKGKLFFTDKILLSASVQAASLLFEQPAPGQVVDPEQVLGIKVIQHMVTDGFFQPICFLQTDEGHIITGTVKEAGLEEPVSTYYLKYGSWGLDDIYIVGFKEVQVLLNEENFSQMLTASRELTDNISDFLCGEDSIRITPLALFRKFQPIKETRISHS